MNPGDIVANRFRIIRFLGGGGVGEVYLVYDQELEVEVALKLLRPEAARDEENLDRFRREVVFARKLEGGHVARIYDLGIDGKQFFIAMEYLSGPSLAAVMAEEGKIDVSEAMAMAKQICEAVAEAHSLGIVHRDLKPLNILFDSAGRIRVMDFGMSRALDASGDTTSGALLGTPRYMAPEQAEGKPADARSDVYAIGLILYEMLTGVFPFQSQNPIATLIQRLRKKPISPAVVAPDIPKWLDRLVMKCLERDRDDRPADAGVLLSLLQLPEREERTGRIGRQKMARWPVLVSLGAALAAIGVLLWTTMSPVQVFPSEGFPLVVSWKGGSLSEGFARHLAWALSSDLTVPVEIVSGEDETDPARSIGIETWAEATESGAVISVTLSDGAAREGKEFQFGPNDVDLSKILQWLGSRLPLRTGSPESLIGVTSVEAFDAYARGLAERDSVLLIASCHHDSAWAWPRIALADLVYESDPERAAGYLAAALELGLPERFVSVVFSRIGLRRGSQVDVLMSLVAEGSTHPLSFEERLLAAKAADHVGRKAALWGAFSPLLRWSGSSDVALRLAILERLKGNSVAAVSWARRAATSPRIRGCALVAEVLAMLQNGEPQRAMGPARELLRLEHSARGYALVAEASLRQGEIRDALEAADEGVGSFPKSYVLGHLQFIAQRELGLDLSQSSLTIELREFSTSEPFPIIETLLYLAPYFPHECERQWWDLVSLFGSRPEMWATGAWIATFLESDSSVTSRLQMAVATGLAPEAIEQDSRFADIWKG